MKNKQILFKNAHKIGTDRQTDRQTDKDNSFTPCLFI